MTIGSAIERGSQVFVYDQQGQMLYAKPRGSGPHDGLLGFSSASVTVRSGSVIFIYGLQGEILYSKPA